MLTKGLRNASSDLTDKPIDCCSECGEPLADVPDGYELEPWHGGKL